ncbi:MAG: cytochrome c biogenesis protein CcsA, partial [Pelagibacterales bacterium]|nr:cytochrome c biogenesis protein CcsA [Pelagibacterales bacterium]
YDGATNITPITNNNLKLHIISSIASYGFLGLAAIQAILLRYQEKKLKYVKESHFISMLPPIEKMEKVMFELIILGFILLTLSLLSGAPFILSGTDQGLIQKILFSIIAWITYSFLIYKRFSVGVRGKKATNLTLSGMAFLFIAYLGTKLFFELF